jgi:hypothetical protein
MAIRVSSPECACTLAQVTAAAQTISETMKAGAPNRGVLPATGTEELCM